MTTLANLIDEVSTNLSGYTLTQDRATHLVAAMTATASTSAVPILMYLGSTDNVGKGIVEVDEELIWVDAFDRLNNTATVAPYGRGYLGTTATTHAVDAKVTISPIFPRVLIKRAINDTITSLGASLPATGTTTLTSSASATAYRFPASGATVNADNVLSVTWQSLGSSGEWLPVRAWKFDQNANSTLFTSGQSLSIFEGLPSGRTINVTYTTDPVAFPALATVALTNAQVFTTVTLLPESCNDIVVLGAIYRLLSNLDPARATLNSPQADETDSKRPYGSSNSATKQIYALYQQRLNEEVRKHQAKNPIRVHRSN